MKDTSNTEFDRERIPRCADAEAVHLSAGKAIHHVGRRQHHQPHILIRIDAAGSHPETQLIIVRRERKGHAESQRLLATCATRGNNAAECARRTDRIGKIADRGAGKRLVQARRYRDGVAVEPEHHRHDERHFEVAGAET